MLNSNKIYIGIEDVLKYSRDDNSIGRYDIAIALKELKYVNSINEAYEKYLDYNGTSYVKRRKLNPFELIKKIIQYGVFLFLLILEV